MVGPFCPFFLPSIAQEDLKEDTVLGGKPPFLSKHLLRKSSLNQCEGTSGCFNFAETNAGGRKKPFCPLLLP